MDDARFLGGVSQLVTEAESLGQVAAALPDPHDGRFPQALAVMEQWKARFETWDAEALQWIERKDQLDQGAQRVPMAYELVLAGRDLCQDATTTPFDPIMVEMGIERLHEAIRDIRGG